MKKFKTKEQLKNYRRYHIPGCGNLNSVKVNAIFLNKHNSIEHEQTKFDLAWTSEIFITEAARSATEKEVEVFKLKKKTKIVDFVDLTSMKEFEIIHKHESDSQIQYYRSAGIFPFLVGDKITCEICKEKYPKRNKGNVCQVCKHINK